MTNYLQVRYNKNSKPHTAYPLQMCRYLFERFGMKKGDKILDIGCGRGDFARAFKDLGLQVTGIDREKGDSEMLNGVDFHLKDDLESEKLPFRDASFDIVFSKSVIEHIKDPPNFMKETYRILKPSGKVITLTPDWHSQMFIFYDDSTHFHPYTLTGLKDLLAMYGFKESKAELFYQLPIVWKYPFLKVLCRCLQLLGPVKKIYKNKFIRWSRELMILAYGEK